MLFCWRLAWTGPPKNSPSPFRHGPQSIRSSIAMVAQPRTSPMAITRGGMDKWAGNWAVLLIDRELWRRSRGKAIGLFLGGAFVDTLAVAAIRFTHNLQNFGQASHFRHDYPT